jgi:dimethylhistidine N-methyltransferase
MREHAQLMASAAAASTSLALSRDEILSGLTAAQKTLSPKYLYDERGSQLFDEISALPEYYPTRTEIGLLSANARAIEELVGAGASIIELGAGSSLKARLLLGCLEQPASYWPVDISAAYLEQQAAEIAAAFPRVRVSPVIADFTQPFALPATLSPERTLVFFPGSTIGNLSREHAAALLRSLARRLRGGALLIGVDICRDPTVLRAAYNDASGVTAAFNLNVLARLNRELGEKFDLHAFDHDAVYDVQHARIEMRLISRRDQVVTVAGVALLFRRGEYIVSEHSHKYAPEEFADMARDAGWDVAGRWIDADARFSVHHFRTH